MYCLLLVLSNVDQRVKRILDILFKIEIPHLFNVHVFWYM